MLLPSIFNHDLFNEVFNTPFSGFGYHTNNLMRTDVRDTEQGYELTIDLPGVKKDDLKAQLKDGYLTISATTGYNNDEQDENSKFIRRERYSGSFARNFYVGEDIQQEDIKAKFENGTLTLLVPKQVAKPQVDNPKYIPIEG